MEEAPVFVQKLSKCDCITFMYWVYCRAGFISYNVIFTVSSLQNLVSDKLEILEKIHKQCIR